MEYLHNLPAKDGAIFLAREYLLKSIFLNIPGKNINIYIGLQLYFFCSESGAVMRIYLMYALSFYLVRKDGTSS